MNSTIKTILLWIALLAVVFSLFNQFSGGLGDKANSVSYSQFIQDVRSGAVSEVGIKERQITATYSNGVKATTYNPGDLGLVGELLDNRVRIDVAPPEEQSMLIQILISWFPMLLLIGVWIYFSRQMAGSSKNGPFSFGRSKARMLNKEQIKTRFKDVAGADEAKEEVSELVAFLREPSKFTRLGGRIPKGVLLVGPPGTGKTLLAKAIAGEANVPFFTISGSDFVEMFVGVGASRVRDMFAQARKNAPCIIFVDEIDAVGRHRGAGMGGGHDEREQTLNQLLVEMDGFEGHEGVIMIAATNRPDVLDPALLRPGRFDRQVVVPLPDLKGREAILQVHMKKVRIAEDVDASIIARGTPGFSGADLANLVNEAALIAARKDADHIERIDLDRAKDKIMMGSERRSMAMDDNEKKLTAYHEAGHAIVGLTVPEHDPVYKVSIIPRGRALGVTMFLPEKDRYSASKQRLNSQIASLFGGRIAEALIFGKDAVTTGASNDIKRATEIARNMVTLWGLSDIMGPLAYGDEEGEIFLGRTVTQHKTISDETAQQVDIEVRAIIDRNYALAEQILKDNIDKLHLMAEALILYETIDSDQINDIMQGNKPKPPAGWQKHNTGDRPVVVDEDAIKTNDTPKGDIALGESRSSL